MKLGANLKTYKNVYSVQVAIYKLLYFISIYTLSAGHVQYSAPGWKLMPQNSTAQNDISNSSLSVANFCNVKSP